MKTSIKSIVIVIASFSAFSAFAGPYGFDHADNASQLSQQVSHATRFNDGRANQPAAYAKGYKAAAAQTAQNQANAAMAMGQVMSDGYAKDSAMAHANIMGSKVTTASSLATNDAAMSQANVVGASYTSSPAAQGSINVDSKSLAPNTPVNTPKGVVKAGDLPAGTQVAVPHVDAIIGSPNVKGGQQGHDHGNNNHGGNGNGQGNAANSNSAHGLGGGNHIGGGSAQSGSRNVGHW